MTYLLLGVRTYGAPQSLKMRRRFKSLSSLFTAALKIIPSARVTVEYSEDGETATAHLDRAEFESTGGTQPEGHDCMDNATPYEGDGPLGHGFECAICGAFLQAG